MPIPAQSPYFPPQYNPYWPYYIPQTMNPIIKTYNINAGGPTADHTKLSMIYEDVLPSKQFANTSNTLGERLNIYNFVRSVFIKINDGEDIDIDGRGDNSLLSYLKFMELNPYNSNQFTNNPYKGLPDDMLIYRSCYPIRYDERTNNIQCAPNSIGMNIRIYKLSIIEYNIKKSQNTVYYDYNIWREVAYYEYVREQIIKRKICPNFVLLYAYYICERCNIDFNKLSQLKGKPQYSQPKQTVNPTVLAQITRPVIPLQNKNTLELIQPIQPQQPIELIGQPPTPKIKPNLPIIDENAFSGRGLILLTEGPTYNLYGWASKTYKVEGNIKRMVNTGYHKSEIWLSILFQMMTALFVLQLHKIAFDDFTVEDNIYIKDISQHENITTYWKYRINNLDYYVPNYGYLVMIDSNYKDIDNQSTLINQQNLKKFKIYSSLFPGISENEINIKCFEAFKNTFNPNSFTKSFANVGGANLPEDILSLLGEIYSSATMTNSKTNIDYYISMFMRKLMNNRIGTYLSEIESRNVRKDDVRSFQSGQIVVNEVQNETYKFVIYLESEERSAIILTKEDGKNDIIEKKIPIDTLFNYSRLDNIVQNFKPTEASLNEEDLLETYIIN